MELETPRPRSLPFAARLAAGMSGAYHEPAGPAGPHPPVAGAHPAHVAAHVAAHPFAAGPAGGAPGGLGGAGGAGGGAGGLSRKKKRPIPPQVPSAGNLQDVHEQAQAAFLQQHQGGLGLEDVVAHPLPGCAHPASLGFR